MQTAVLSVPGSGVAQPIGLSEAACFAQMSVDDIINRVKANPGGTLVAKVQVTRKATGAVENWTLVFKDVGV